jgi:hypothetical protein
MKYIISKGELKAIIYPFTLSNNISEESLEIYVNETLKDKPQVEEIMKANMYFDIFSDKVYLENKMEMRTIDRFLLNTFRKYVEKNKNKKNFNKESDIRIYIEEIANE